MGETSQSWKHRHVNLELQGIDEWTNERTNERTHERTNERTNGRALSVMKTPSYQLSIGKGMMFYEWINRSINQSIIILF